VYDVLFSKKGTFGNNKQEVGVAQDVSTGRWEVDYFNIKNKSFETYGSKREAVKAAVSYMKKNDKPLRF